jgi:hypothetical protein
VIVIIVNFKLECTKVICIVLMNGVVLGLLDPNEQMTDSEISADNKNPPHSFLLADHKN